MILPFNATPLEKNLYEATNYKLDVAKIKGFKFQEVDDNWLSLALSWEFSLSEINIENFSKRLKEGVEFFRIKGTPRALRIALSWYGLYDIIIEEDGKGVHFSEFQVGLKGIPNNMDIKNIIQAAEKSKPLRSRLSRMYNDEYDVRQLVLDESPFGYYLSGCSGIRLDPDGPLLSFGRKNTFYLEIPKTEALGFLNRNHFKYANSSQGFKLSGGTLDSTIWYFKLCNAIIFRDHFLKNEGKIGNDKKVFFPDHFSKASIILSHSKIGDINTCFSSGYTEKKQTDFRLGFDKLSGQRVIVNQVDINERFLRNSNYYAKNIFVHTASSFSERNFFKYANAENERKIISFTSRDHNLDSAASGLSNSWHDHKHFDVPWDSQAGHTKFV